MFTEAFETFLNSLAYFFWPFVFALVVIYFVSKHITLSGSVKKKSQKKKRDDEEKQEMEHLAEKAILFKQPKLETSFGDQRIGDIHGHEKKD